jgi:signal transduction histidine kinase
MASVIRFDGKNKKWSGNREDLANVLDHLPEPLAYFNADQELTACNQRFREAFPVVIEQEFLRRHGAASNVRTPSADMVPRARPTDDGGTLVTYHDITPFKMREAVLRRRIERLTAQLSETQAERDQAQDAARARKDVLVSTSHELRTPLNAILGFAEMMQQEVFGALGHDRYREYAGIIHKSGSHLLGMINDLLDLSKLDAGKLELHPERVEILKVILDCVRAIEPQAAKVQIGVSVRVFDGINEVMVDDKRLHQMLLNLLSNALKFTPERGEISVEVFRRGGNIAISVTDTGIGIAPEDIPAVLEPFGQVDSEMSRKHMGTGLGLPLTKELAELHGGSLTMESATEVGTTVTILLPTALPDSGNA